MTQGRPMLYIALGCLGFVSLLTLSGGVANAQDKDKPVVVMETSEGTITIELDRAKAPVTVDNFLKYVDDGFYNGTIFHRVIPGFMIQGGGFEEKATSPRDTKKTRATIKNEANNGLKNLRGTLAMARTSDPDSASSQFFINLTDNGFLDKDQAADGFGYTVFAKVVEGMDVVDKIAKAKASRGALSEGQPATPIVIKSARRKDK
jgi:cyclophilin family peptidyl-prolyl cis-trans isomerase